MVLIQGLIFFIIFTLFWYVSKIKNVLGLGANITSKQEALNSALRTAALATAIYVVVYTLLSSLG